MLCVMANLAVDVRFGSRTDIEAQLPDVRFTPESGHCGATVGCPLCAKSGHWPTSADHLVGGGEQRLRHGQPECLCGFEIDDQFILGGRLHWEIARLLTPENAIDIAGRARAATVPQLSMRRNHQDFCLVPA
jgi:hypothetical protein